MALGPTCQQGGGGRSPLALASLPEQRTIRTGAKFPPSPGQCALRCVPCCDIQRADLQPEVRGATEQVQGEALCNAPAWNVLRPHLEHDHRTVAGTKDRQGKRSEACIRGLQVNYLLAEFRSQISNHNNGHRNNDVVRNMVLATKDKETTGSMYVHIRQSVSVPADGHSALRCDQSQEAERRGACLP